MAFRIINYLAYFILVHFFFLESITSFSQNQSKSKLQTDDTIKIKNILKYAKEYEKTNPDTALFIINNLIKGIKDTKNKYFTDAIIAKGSVFYYRGNSDSALIYFKYANQLSIKHKFRYHEIQSLNFIGLCHKKTGNLTLSLKFFNQSVEKSKLYGFKKREAAAYNNIGLTYRDLGIYDQSIHFFSEAYHIDTEIQDTSSLMSVMNNLGLINKDIKKYDEAMSFYLKMLSLANKCNDIIHKSMAYLNMGVVYKEKNELEKALEYFNKSLKLKKVIGDEYKIAINLSDIAEIYSETGNYKKAVTFFNEAHDIYEKRGSIKEKILSNNNLASVLIKMGQFKKAFTYLNISLKLLEKYKSEDFNQYTSTYQILSLYYQKTNSYKKALEYHILYTDYKDSIKTRELNDKIAQEKVKFDYKKQEKEIQTLTKQQELDQIKLETQKQRLRLTNIINSVILLFTVLSVVFIILLRRQLRKNNKINALLRDNRKIILEKNYEITQQNEEIKAQTDQLYEINKELSQFKAAVSETDNAVVILDEEGYFLWANKGFDKLYDIDFKNFINKYPHITDAVKNKINYEDIIKVINRTINEKTVGTFEFTDFNKYGNKIWIKASIKAVLDDMNEIQNFIVIDTDITENVETRRLIELQNFELHKQKEEIDSGLRYALTIQNAMLPSLLNMKKYHDFFYIYMPKDIVSGDFYWYYESEYNPFIYYAIIDCTGHGVPGAFMSLIGEGLLTHIVNEKKMALPSEILEEMNASIKNVLKQKLSGNRDGMDISLCRIEKTDKEIKEVIFCGAQQSIYHYNQKNKKLLKIRGDIKSIGGHFHDDITFTDKHLKVRNGDMLYLLTDGYADQDSPEGKKTGSKKLFVYLEETASLPLNEQKEYLIQRFNEHKKGNHQRDDITFFGIKIGK